jgi:hypothetical protein
MGRVYPPPDCTTQQHHSTATCAAAGSEYQDCVQLDGFIALPGVRRVGDDFPGSCGPNIRVPPLAELAEECRSNPLCASFNAAGCMKSMYYVNEVPAEPHPDGCLYQKIKPGRHASVCVCVIEGRGNKAGG